MLILFLCRESDLLREALGYARAFERRGVRLAYVHDSLPYDISLDILVSQCPEKPSLIFHPEAKSPFFPHGLAGIDIPTACCHYDVYAYTDRRTRWAMLFDYAFLFHPGFEESFRTAGHPNPITVSHAIERDVFLEKSDRERDIEVAWVGRMDGSLYHKRRQALPILATNFRMNDWERSYSYEGMAAIYKCSKIGLNIARDDYPEDANLRIFEIMAAGALLVTSLPSELEKLGFQSDTHFVGYRDHGEIPGCIRYYLEHDTERELMARAGSELVLKEHTYDRRAEKILQILGRDGGKLFAPARSWPEERVGQVYLDYYCANNLLGCAFKELRRLSVIRPARVWSSLPPILGAVRRELRNRTANFANAWVHK